MTTEICKHCNGWRGLHKWDTMQCPYMGYENEMWQETTYEEADETAATTIAAQAARIAELEAALKRIAEMGENGSMSYTMAEVARALLETK